MGIVLPDQSTKDRALTRTLYRLRKPQALGYNDGLQKSVNTQRRSGCRIRFFSDWEGPIKFRRSWIEEFIEANTIQAASIYVRPCRSAPMQPEVIVLVLVDLYW